MRLIKSFHVQYSPQISSCCHVQDNNYGNLKFVETDNMKFLILLEDKMKNSLAMSSFESYSSIIDSNELIVGSYVVNKISSTFCDEQFASLHNIRCSQLSVMSLCKISSELLYNNIFIDMLGIKELAIFEVALSNYYLKSLFPVFSNRNWSEVHRVYVYSDDMMKWLMNRHINIYSISCDFETLQGIAFYANDLLSIEIYPNTFMDNRIDAVTGKSYFQCLSSILSKCPNLLNLHIAEEKFILNCVSSLWIETSIIDKCPNLRSLKLTSCNSINFKNIIDGLPKLEKLELLHGIYKSVSVSPIVFTQFQKNIDNRVFKALSYENFNSIIEMIEFVPYFSNIIELNIGLCQSITDEQFDIILQYCNKLIKLNIDSCNSLTDKSIESINRYCRQLKEFSFGGPNTTMLTTMGCEMLNPIIQNLEYLQMHASNTSLSSRLIENLFVTVQNYSNLIEFESCVDFSIDDMLDVLTSHHPNLEKLDLYSEYYYSPDSLIILGKNCKKLKSLSILLGDSFDDGVLDPKCVKIFLKNCKDLKFLHLVDFQLNDSLVELFRDYAPKLKEVLIGSLKLSPEGFEHLHHSFLNAASITISGSTIFNSSTVNLNIPFINQLTEDFNSNLDTNNMSRHSNLISNSSIDSVIATDISYDTSTTLAHPIPRFRRPRPLEKLSLDLDIFDNNTEIEIDYRAFDVLFKCFSPIKAMKISNSIEHFYKLSCRLTTVQKLEFKTIESFNNNGLLKFIKNFPGVRFIEFTNCQGFNEFSISILIAKCENLSRIQFNNCKKFKDSKIKCLSDLHPSINFISKCNGSEANNDSDDDDADE